MASSTARLFLPEVDIEPLRLKWGWVVALGALYLIVGLIALVSVVMATRVSVFVVGVMMLIGGIGQVINAFQVKGWGKFLLMLLIGALYIAAGFVTFENPWLTAAFLTLFLAFSLIASGCIKIALAFSVGMASRFWIVLSGLISLFLGMIILIHWPVSSLFVLGMFLGIDLVFAGVGWISLGLGARQAKAAIA
jgi:uncharacterized membrane protein HdeD (DUF308 family)